MKKASVLVIILGIAVLVFSIVCFVKAAELDDIVEESVGDLSYPGIDMDAGDLLDVADMAGIEIKGFEVFAYRARFWLLGGSLALLGAGLIMLKVSSSRPAYSPRSAYSPGSAYGPRPENRAQRRCPVCGAANKEGSMFCVSCGSALNAAPAAPAAASARYCTNCGAANEADSMFCVSCGSPLSAPRTADAPARETPFADPEPHGETSDAGYADAAGSEPEGTVVINLKEPTPPRPDNKFLNKAGDL